MESREYIITKDPEEIIDLYSLSAKQSISNMEILLAIFEVCTN